jgi:tetratricopeptide (TPR) repeat protein
MQSLWIALTLFAAEPLALQESAEAPAPITYLRLYEGGILWGSIAEHDAQGVVFTRLDNGGRVRLAWSRLDPAQAEALQESFGLVDHTSEELFIEADRLVLDNGEERIGRIVHRTTDEIHLKTANGLVLVPKLRLRGAATVVQSPALDVYSGEELYQQELARLAGDDAASHYGLARFCERILEFERAAEHYRRARELDPSYAADDIDGRLARAEERAKNRKQLEVLREIDTLRVRGRFDQALDLATGFAQLFPGSELESDAARRKTQVEKARVVALRERVPASWHVWLGRLAQQKARDPELTLDAAIGWSEEALTEEILAAVHKDLSATVTQAVTPEEIQRYWTERKGGAVQKASYGAGTWLLGADGARAGMPEEEPDLTAMNETERARAKLQEQVARFLASQTAKVAAKDSPDQVDETQAFWAGWSASERKQWLVARYAEKGGQMKLVRLDLSPCQECGGSGVREVTNVNAAPSRPGQQGGASNVVEQVVCPLCHNVGVVRRVVYR